MSHRLEPIARINKVDLGELIQKYNQYVINCENFDQSPALQEFLNWNNLKEVA